MKKLVLCIFACAVTMFSAHTVFGETDVEKSLRDRKGDRLLLAIIKGYS